MQEAATKNVRKTTFKKRTIVEKHEEECETPKDYEMVTFIFWNEEQRGAPQFYEWVDKWTPLGKCTGTFYDGQKYTLPRIAFEYYKNQCSEPKYAQVEQEMVPGQIMRAAKEVGRKYRFRLEEVK